MTRLLRAAPFRFVVLALVLVALILSERSAQAYFTNGIAYGTAALQSYPDVPANRYGVNAFLDEDVYDWQLDRDFQAIHDAGFGWVRQEFLWAQIEPGAKGNHYDAKNHVDAWAKWDRIVADAQRYHVKIIARLDYAPDWATAGNPDSGRCPTLCPPPNNPRDFADFAGAVAARYRGKIAAYQLWNEPNLQHEWAGKPISPAAYTALLKAGYLAIKAADPSALVISAPLAPNRGDSPNNMSDLAFLRAMYAAGAKSYFDVLGAQAYGLDHPTYDRQLGFHSTDFPRALLPQAEPFTFDRPVLLHQIMAANGDANKAVWVTEFGWMSLPPNWQGNPSPWFSVSSTVRQQSTLQAWTRAATEWPWMGPLTLWYLRDPVPADPRDPTPHFAILSPDWQPTPLYTAIKAQATAPPLAATGMHAPTAPAAVYGPHGFAQAWHTGQDGGAPLQVAGAAGANMRFQFRGDALWLSVAKGPTGGRARVTIDGVPGLANLLPADATGDRILDTYAPTPQPPTLVAVASGMPEEAHQLDLEVLGAHDAAAKGTDIGLAGFGVTIEQPAIWSYLKLALALAAGLLLLWPATALARWAWASAALGGALRATVKLGPTARGRPAFALGAATEAVPAAPQTVARPPFPVGAAPRGRPGPVASTDRVRKPEPGGHRGPPLRQPPALARPLAWAADDRVLFGAWIVALLLFYLGPKLPVTLLGATLMLALGLWRPDLGVLLVPATVALEFLPKHVGGSEVLLSEATLGVCVAGWLLRCYWQQKLLLARGPLTPLALTFLVVGLISLFAAEFPRYSFRDYREVIIEPVLYFILVSTLLTPARLARLLAAIVAAGTAVALAGLAGYALHRGVVAAEGVGRLSGIYPSPDNLALYLDRPLALAAGIALWTNGRWRRLCALACLPMLAAILLTFSKGAWGAVFVTAALLGLFVNWRLLLAAAAGVAAAIVAALVTHVRRLTTTFQFGPSSTTGRRVLLWQSAWQMARDHPVQGVGLDNFLYQYPRYRLPGADSEPFLSHPHNFILDFWLSLGVLGLAWLAWAVVTIVRVARWTLGARERQARAFALGLTASLVVAAVHGMVDNSYFLPDLAVLFWGALAGLQILSAGRAEHELDRKKQ